MILSGAWARAAERFLHRWTAILAAAAVGLLTLATGSGAPVDRAVADLRDSVRSHAASGEVHIVEIDAASLASIAKWPWPRSIHAGIIDRLRAAGARSIAFDVDFSAASDPAQDAALAAALERAEGKVVLPTFRQSASASDTRSIDAMPIAPLRDKAFVAVVNVTPDNDGYVRTMPLGLKTDGVARPSLAAMVAESDARIGRDFDIDFSIDPKTIPRHSVVDLIEGRIPPSELAGRRVIIGASAVEMGDRYAVPRHGVIPGVVIQALATETLMEGPAPQRWSGLWGLLAALVLLTVAVRPTNRAYRVAALVATMTALLVLPILAMHWLAATLPVAAGIAAVAMAAGIRGAGWIMEAFSKRALTDAATGLPNLAALQRDAAVSPRLRIVVARIEDLARIASTLGPAQTVTFIARLEERLRYATGVPTLYRVDDAVLAWIDPAAGETEARIDEAIDSMRHPIECGRRIDASIRLGIADGEGPSATQIVANALLAATNAAEQERPFTWFDEAVGHEADRQLMLLSEVDSALRLGQIWNAYQPKLDLATGRIIGAEALVRWDHPERGTIRPDAFIPIIEKAGRIRDLTLHVLRQAQDDALGWRKLGLDINVAVNVSAKLLADHGFIEIVRATLQSHALPAQSLTIEVTESAAVAAHDQAIAALESWRSLGVNISIDDYGTGQSSLSYLQKLPATELKIDKSFVQTLASDTRNAAMVRSTISLAHELGMSVVAEGVEDRQCLATLAQMGCDKAQGYLIGKPVPAETFVGMLNDDFRMVA